MTTLILGLSSTGCQPALTNPHEHGGGLVDEYRPADPATERPAPASGEYVLWRWQPVPAVAASGELLGPATAPTTAPSTATSAWVPAVQVAHVYVHHGQPIGFRRRPDGLLVAVAGPTTRPLAAGRYCWHRLPRDGATRRDALDVNRHRRDVVNGFIVVGVAAVVVGGIVAAVVAIDHNDRHAHVADGIIQTLNGDGD